MNTRYEQSPRRRLRFILSGLLGLGTVVLALVIFGLSRGATAASAPAPDVDISADSLQLSPGDTLAVKVRVTNPLTNTLSKITVKLAYDSGQITPFDSDFHRDSDWVSDLNESRVTLTFKDIGAGKSRSGTVLFHVNRPMPGNTSVDLRAKYTWSVNAGTSNPALHGSGSTDGDEPLIVAPDGVLTNPNVIDSVPQAAIEPRAGGVGSVFRAYASGFTGGERISIWLNTPSGAAAVPHDLIANANGEVWPEFSSDNLVPGNYGLVIYGQQSTQTLVVPFTIGGSAAPQPVGVPQPVAQPQPAGLSANIEPTNASAGTEFHAYARGFAGGERISIWLNTPSGAAAVPHDLVANANGEVWPAFSSDGLVSGSYGLVIYGQESARTVVVPFAIGAYAAPAAVAPPAAVVPALAVPSPFGLWGTSVSTGGAPAAQQATITPSAAAAGTQFHAYARGFGDGEPVSIWLNTPSGVQALDGSFSANSAGEVWPEFSSAGLAPGSYSLVIYGRSGGQTLVVAFVING